ncbi:uncharacterized protein V1510DRAFT_409628 [Dipodascopsis tothii]|uniref:uncharacterized protein n=1 Tax=Dipodascopsis tothii TaxID=44089 RepID=UPI0034CD738E
MYHPPPVAVPPAAKRFKQDGQVMIPAGQMGRPMGSGVIPVGVSGMPAGVGLPIQHSQLYGQMNVEEEEQDGERGMHNLPPGAILAEKGGLGDEIDGLSAREISAARFVRHHEWMEEILGTAYPWRNIVPPDLFSKTGKTRARTTAGDDLVTSDHQEDLIFGTKGEIEERIRAVEKSTELMIQLYDETLKVKR